MKLTFLGTGDAFARKQGHNSVLLEIGNTLTMIDCPSSNRHSLSKMKKELSDVKHVIVTHLHEDHINGIQQFAYFHEIVVKQKPHLYIHEGLVNGLWETVKQGLHYTTKGKKELKDYFVIHSLKENEEFKIEGIPFQFIQTNHVPDMLSFGVLSSERFYFSADSNVDLDFLNKIHSKIDTIFHDCHLWDLKIDSHASLEDILSLPEEIKKKVVLMHYHDGYANFFKRKTLEYKTKIPLAYPFKTYFFK